MTGSDVYALIAPGQGRRAAGAGDDDADAASRGRLGELAHLVRRAVGGDDVRLVGDAELVEGVEALLHGGGIGLRAHDDGDDEDCSWYLQPFRARAEAPPADVRAIVHPLEADALHVRVRLPSRLLQASRPARRR